MFHKNFLSRTVFAVALFATSATLADAAQFTPWHRVGQLQAGWVVDRMLVFPATGALTNPDGCTIINNGYIIKETDPVHRTLYAMLLGAFLNRREVAYVVSGCFENRPRIVSVAVR